VFRKRSGGLAACALILLLLILARFVISARNAAVKTALRTGLIPEQPRVENPEEGEDEPKMGVMLPLTPAVGQEYFADTVFIGDSITDGLKIYDVFGDVIAISYTGISAHSATYFPFYRVTPDSEKITMVEAVEYYHPRRLYIMLGTNSIDGGTVEWNLEAYALMLDDLAVRVPDTAIVIQSIPPTTPETAERRPSFSRENLQKYNQGLLDLALNRGLYYLDVNAALADENGYLREDISAGDGIHMTPDGYQMWYDYIVTHAVSGDAAFAIDEYGRFVAARPGGTGDEAQQPSE